jgi:hypothetical protein
LHAKIGAQSHSLARKLDRMRYSILGLLLALACPAGAGEAAPAQQENFFKRAGKAIAKDAKAGWNQAGRSYSQAGKQAGQGTAKATKKLGKEMKQSAKKTGKAAKETF